jgi:hypothetical protein
MKEEKFKLDSFIGGWYINEKTCENIIDFFEKNKSRQVKGLVGANKIINTNIKNSTDVSLHSYDTLLDDYNIQLQKCLNNYIKKYPEINSYAEFNSGIEGYNIQRYLPGEGFYKLHWERDHNSSRCLVFMTYLNNVKNGGTYFKYQNITTEAKKGLTLIWPTDFTHTHQGKVAKETKYILTGWYNFVR